MADKKKSAEELVSEIFDDNLRPERKMLERIWFRNILYYIGEQYIEWVVNLNTFRRRPIHPLIPTPVSNVVRDYVRSMKALMLNKDYTIRVWPNSNDQEDREAAILGEHLLQWMDSENDEEFKDEEEKIALWILLTGNAFMRTFPMKDRGEFGIDKNGNIVKTGEVVCENIMPFNVGMDNLGDSLKKKRYIRIQSLKPREWIEDTFKEKIKAEDDSSHVNYQIRLMKLISDVSPWKGSGLQTQIMGMKEEGLAIFKEVEFRPTVKYPNGRYIIAIGKDQILFDKPVMPIPVEKDKWDYSITDYHYNYVPGRFWSDAGVNDIISPQNIINSIDQDCEINRKGLGQPYVLTPTNIELKRLDKFGHTLKVIEYDASTAQGTKPEVKAGTPLPQQFLDNRKIQEEVVQGASGDPKHILRGESPTSKASGYMVDILKEAAESGHTPDIDRFYRSKKRVYRKRLILAKNLYTEKRMIKIAGKGQDIRIIAFKGSDLRNNTDVRLELASGAMTTKAGQTQTITNLVQTGMFGDLTQNPEIKVEILRRLGLSGFQEKTSVDVERAEEENMKILAIRKNEGEKIEGIFLVDINKETGKKEVVNDDPFFRFDDHTVHYETHRKCILSKEFKETTKESQTILMAHNDIHKQLMIEEQQRMMEQQMMMKGKGEEPKSSEAK